MSHEATNWAFEQRGLKPATKMVLLGLANRHNPDFGCFPSKKKLAEDCEMSERSVTDHLKKLEEAGLIRIESHAGPSRGHFASNRYILGFEGEICRRQDLPSAKSAVGKKQQHRRQNLPTNPVRETGKVSKEKETTSAELFDRFWAVYPKKAGKKEAQRAFTAAIKRADPETIISQAKKYAAWLSSGNGEFRPSPKNAQGWLTADRWEDAYDGGTTGKSFAATVTAPSVGAHIPSAAITRTAPPPEDMTKFQRKGP